MRATMLSKRKTQMDNDGWGWRLFLAARLYDPIFRVIVLHVATKNKLYVHMRVRNRWQITLIIKQRKSHRREGWSGVGDAFAGAVTANIMASIRGHKGQPARPIPPKITVLRGTKIWAMNVAERQMSGRSMETL